MVGTRPHIVVVGSGGRPYREYSFVSLAARYRLSLVLAAEPTWQRPYAADWAVADLTDPAAIAAAVSRLSPAGDAGMLTWDETVLAATAQAAEKLGLAHMSSEAVDRCRDKHATRLLTAEAGLPAVRSRLVNSSAAAVAAADDIGYPVVVKPRALAGSIGVVLARDAAGVERAYAVAAGSRFADLPTGHGVLIEEFLDGPEVSVDSVVAGGTVHCVHVARKRLGFAPYFEEVGHYVGPPWDEPWEPEVRALVAAAHAALGVDRGVTHSEVRLTPAGPRLVELNARLGGDLIPYLGTLATGVDLVAAAAGVALGQASDLAPSQRRAAEVRFAYPPHDCVVRRIDVTAAAAVEGICHALALAGPGDRLLLPPQAAIPRLAALVAVADDAAACRRSLDQAERALSVDLEPLA